MAKSKIEWTNVTWNPVTGCSKVSSGCKNCYAEKVFNDRLATNPKLKRYYGRKFTDVQCHEELLELPLHWKKPRMIFVNSMSDLFHEKVPFEFIDKIFRMMYETPRHTYQILTKRAERMLEYQLSRAMNIVIENVWFGVSVENQKTADERREYLRQVPATVRWVSYEPALEKVNWKGWEFLDWLVVGGESGPKKRPCDLEWFRYSRDWAEAYNVKFFMKQVDKVQPIPKDLHIREYPNVR